MKKIILILVVGLTIALQGNAVEIFPQSGINFKSNEIIIPQNAQSKSHLDNQNGITKAAEVSQVVIGIPLVTTCGTDFQYYPPAGESCQNFVTSIMNINNAICGTNFNGALVALAVCGIAF